MTFAQKTPRLLGSYEKIMPLGAYKILRMDRIGGQNKIEVGPYLPYRGGEGFPTKSSSVAFDSFEFNPATIGTTLDPAERGDYGASCGLGANRWVFDDAYTNGGSYNDMTVVSGTAGVRANRAGVAFYCQLNHAFTNLAVVIGTSENFVSANTGAGGAFDGGVNSRGDLDRYLVVFGPRTNTTNVYYVADIDASLFGGPISWKMPVDGSGGYYVVPGDWNAGTQVMTLGFSQQMNWGCKAGNPSSQGGNQWDDDFPLDGQWTQTANELYNYTGYNSNGSSSACPDPGCAMITFLYAAPAVLAPTALNVLLGSISTGSVTDLAATDDVKLKLCKALVPTLTSPKIRFDLDYLSPYATATAITLNVNANMNNGGSFAIRGFIADRTGGGFTYGSANQVIADTAILLNGGVGQVFSGASTNVANNIYTDLTMRVRVEIQQTGLSPVAVPCASFDSATLTVTP